MIHDTEYDYQALLDAGERVSIRREAFADEEEEKIRSDLLHQTGVASVEILEQLSDADVQRVLGFAYVAQLAYLDDPMITMFDRAIAAVVQYRIKVAESKGELEDDGPDDEFDYDPDDPDGCL